MADKYIMQCIELSLYKDRQQQQLSSFTESVIQFRLSLHYKSKYIPIYNESFHDLNNYYMLLYFAHQ